MPGLPERFQLDRYGITPADIVRGTLLCEPEDVTPRTIITPCWPVTHLFGEETRVREVGTGMVYRLDAHGMSFTLVRSGVGAPMTGDAVLALGCTPCTDLVFTGSVGGLDARLQIGDLVLVDRSVSGEGFSRYLQPEASPADMLYESAAPDALLTEAVADAATETCNRDGVTLHRGAVYSIDTIVAQFSRIDHLAGVLGCIGIEMETSAVFNAARLVGIRAAALLQLSDVVPARKSLYAGRSEAERAHRTVIRSTTLPEAITKALATAG